MSRSLIRKNQLHPDIADLVGQYGSGFFQSPFQSVLLTGNQTVDDVKNFSSRPTFDGIGLATTGEISGNNITPLRNGQDVVTFLNNTYFPIKGAAIFLQGYTLKELGTIVNPINFTGTITINDAIVRDLKYKISGTQVGGTVTNPAPNAINSFNYGIEQPIGNTTEFSVEASSIMNAITSGISGSQTMTFEAPHYWGIATTGLQPSQITGLNKVLASKYTPTFNFNTTNNYMYFAYPALWGSVSSIKDGNGYTITSDFNFSGSVQFPLMNSSTHSYNVYISKLATQGNYYITFNF